MTYFKTKEFKVQPNEDLQEKLNEAIDEIGEKLGIEAHIVTERITSVVLRESFPVDPSVPDINHVEVWVIFIKEN